MINPRHRKAIDLFMTTLSLSEVAHICSLTQDRVRRVWKAAQDRGELPNIDRKSEGFSDMCIFLGQIGNQCSPERRIA